MNGADLAGQCQALAAQLAVLPGSDDAHSARIMAEHVAVCPTCAAAEAALVALVAGYRAAGDLPLAPDRERRLLDRLCGAG